MLTRTRVERVSTRMVADGSVFDVVGTRASIDNHLQMFLDHDLVPMVLMAKDGTEVEAMIRRDAITGLFEEIKSQTWEGEGNVYPLSMLKADNDNQRS